MCFWKLDSPTSAFSNLEEQKAVIPEPHNTKIVNFFSWCNTITRYNQGKPYGCAFKTSSMLVTSSVKPGTDLMPEKHQ